MEPVENANHGSRWSRALALAVFIAAAAVMLIGWVADVDPVKRIHPEFAAMVPSTAACFMLLSGGLLALGRRVARRVPMLCAVVAGSFGAADLLVLLTSDRAGIDDYFLFPLGPGDGMAFATAASVLLAAFALATLTRRDGWGARAFEVTATVGLLAAMVALVGYAFDTRALYGVFVFTAMALHTALLFAVLFAALLLAAPQYSWVGILTKSEPGSAGARRLMPIVAVAPVLFCFVALKLTDTGLFDANFRLSLVAIAMTTLAGAAVLRNGYLENKAYEGRTRLMRDLERTNEERALLLKELYHRVKNNLQQIDAMLRIEARQIGDDRLSASLKSISERVAALGVVHQLLISSTSPSEVEVGAFLTELGRGLSESHGLEARGIALEVEAEPGRAHIEVAISMGLLVNELVTNAIKHAFPDRAGRIMIRYVERRDGLVLSVSDDGVGQADGRQILAGGGTGSLLIRSMVAQLKAEVLVAPGTGTHVVVTMPADINQQDRYE